MEDSSHDGRKWLIIFGDRFRPLNGVVGNPFEMAVSWLTTSHLLTGMILQESVSARVLEVGKIH